MNRDEGGALLLVIDPQRRRLLRRVVLGKQVWWFARLHDRAAFLLVPEGRFGAAEVGVVGADGDVRRTTIDGISVGSIVDQSGDEPSFSQRGAGFAVWTVRTVDLEANWVRLAGDTMLAQRDGPVTVAYGPDGRERWRTTIPQYSWLDARGDYAYVCDNGYLRRVLDVRTGTTTASFPRTSNRRCAALLTQ